MAYSKTSQNTRLCLECGDAIEYGRVTKKFCCEECRNRYHYKLNRNYRSIHLRVSRALEKNHEILDRLLEMSVASIALEELEDLGFDPSYMTACRKAGPHIEYRCYDIKYFKSDRRIFSLERVLRQKMELKKLG
jgi:predicted nucleic acid-binding Zn ribbon protein